MWTECRGFSIGDVVGFEPDEDYPFLDPGWYVILRFCGGRTVVGAVLERRGEMLVAADSVAIPTALLVHFRSVGIQFSPHVLTDPICGASSGNTVRLTRKATGSS